MCVALAAAMSHVLRVGALCGMGGGGAGGDDNAIMFIFMFMFKE